MPKIKSKTYKKRTGSDVLPEEVNGYILDRSGIQSRLENDIYDRYSLENIDSRIHIHTNPDFNAQYKPNGEITYVCSMCSTVEHVDLEDNSYQRNISFIAFGTKYLYLRHIQKKHKPHCGACKLDFPSWSSYNDHIVHCTRLTNPIQRARNRWAYSREGFIPYDKNYSQRRPRSYQCDYCHETVITQNWRSHQECIQCHLNSRCKGFKRRRLFNKIL